MTDLPEFPWLSDADGAQMQVLREAVAPVLGIDLLPHFTDHSVTHSDRLVELLANLVQTIPSDRQLTKDEAFVLVASCYLHDLGMQYERAGDTNVIGALGLPIPWEQLAAKGRRQLLRTHHHEISAELVARVSGAGANLSLPLPSGHRRTCIASLCEAHGLDTKSDHYKEITTMVAGVRMPLLAALLRVADMLDESSRRVDHRKAAALLLDIESKVHWWRHFYTTNVTLNSETRQICLSFQFPASRREEYSAIIPYVQVPEIESEMARHASTFVKAGFQWWVTHEIVSGPHATAPEMPEEVLAAIQRILHQQKAEDAERQKQVMVRSFLEARPHIARRISELEEAKKNIPPDEYIDGLLQIAEHLRSLGGRQSAWLILHGEFQRLAASLLVDRQVKVALWLIDAELEDGRSREALRTMQVVEGLTQNANVGQKLDILRAQARVFFCNAVYEQTLEPLKKAIRLAPDKPDLRAMLCELHLLHGELSSARYRRSRIGRHMAADSRGILADAKATAMTKGATAAVRRIDKFLKEGGNTLSKSNRMDLQVLKAEILMLDGQEDEAASALPSSEDDVADLSDEKQMAIADNDCLLSMYRKHFSQADFSRLRDLRRLLGVRIWKPEALLAADDAAAADQHWEALPQYWMEFVRAYRLRCWRSHGWAAARLTREYLALEMPVEATYYCLIANDDKLADAVGKKLLESTDDGQVAKAVRRLQSDAHLLRHAGTAARVLGVAVDVIPDDQVEAVIRWALPHCRTSPDSVTRTSLLKQSWKLLTSLAPRSKLESVRTIVRAAIKHSVWAQQHHVRKHLVEAVTACVWSGILTTTDLAHLADRALPLACERKHDLDYAHVLDLLCHIAQRAGKRVRNRIGRALYPKGLHAAHPYLAQTLHVFGEDRASVQNLPEIVDNVTRNMKLWVQRLPAHAEPEKVSSTFGNVSSVRGDTRTVVQMASGVDLEIVVRHADVLQRKSLNRLITAIIDMVRDRDNSLGNKTLLVKVVESLSPHLTQSMCRLAWGAFDSLVSGDVGERGLAAAKETKNPLNPYKFYDVSPQTLSGLALRTLATIERHHPGVYGAKIVRLAERALLDGSGERRAWAFAAVARLPKPSDLAINGVLLGTRDSNPEAARSAFGAVGPSMLPRLQAHHWELLIHSVQLAAAASDASVRRAVALLVSRNAGLPKARLSAWRRIRETLSKDRCWSVRHALSEERGRASHV